VEASDTQRQLVVTWDVRSRRQVGDELARFDGKFDGEPALATARPAEQDGQHWWSVIDAGLWADAVVTSEA
jgi:hypothetical protein